MKKDLESIVDRGWVVQKEKGGCVGEFLAERGHTVPLQELDNPGLQVTKLL